MQGHTPSSAPSPLSVASFDDGVLAPCTSESLSPDFPSSQYPLFSPSQRSSEGTATASLDDHSSDNDVQIVSQTPSGDGNQWRSQGGGVLRGLEHPPFAQKLLVFTIMNLFSGLFSLT